MTYLKSTPPYYHHNLSRENESMPDPLLTPHGEDQCRKLSQAFPYHNSVSLIVASPLRRTIYTALLGFPQEIKRGLRIIALPEAQETTAVACDTGSDPETLSNEFKDGFVDLGLVKDGWNSKTGKWGPEAAAITARAREVRQWLKARSEKEIVLVTHGGFLHYLTEDWSDFKKNLGTGWSNTEYRSYEFKDESGDNASMIETKESRNSRLDNQSPPSGTEHAALARTKSADSNGFIPSKIRKKERDWISAFF